MTNEETVKFIENLKESAKQRWPIAHMFIDAEADGRWMHISSFLKGHLTPVRLGDHENRLWILFRDIDYVEKMTAIWYKWRGTYDNSEKMIARYPDLCRWGYLRVLKDDDGYLYRALLSEDGQRMAKFNDRNAGRIIDYFKTYERWRQAIENVYRILPLPIAEEIGKFTFFWLDIKTIEIDYD